MESPTFVRFQLGAQLRRVREDANVTAEQAAEVIEVSASTLRRIEAGRVGIKGPALNALLDRYGVTDAELRDTLLSMAKSGKQRGWWARYGDLPSSYRQYIGLESAAEEVHNFETLVVPGLLQTADYARALTSADAIERSPEAVERRVAVRMKRQELIASGKLRLLAVLDEAVLRRQIGGAAVMADQLTALLDAAKRWNVTVQVIPFREGAHASMVSSFHILNFADGPRVVYIEGITGDLYAEGEDVRRCTVVFNSLRAAALSPSDSTAMIEEIRSARRKE
ncbi:helix-turn-helix transcriptional regulator [Micromonospora sp. NPDC052213]|uniref:helix-turn-helix domain-containing protein n=1 Tax=Micromonospora sp. NPDC052213 TaxID=3155812 RepID=UPI00341CCD08